MYIRNTHFFILFKSAFKFPSFQDNKKVPLYFTSSLHPIPGITSKTSASGDTWSQCKGHQCPPSHGQYWQLSTVAMDSWKAGVCLSYAILRAWDSLLRLRTSQSPKMMVHFQWVATIGALALPSMVLQPSPHPYSLEISSLHQKLSFLPLSLSMSLSHI